MSGQTRALTVILAVLAALVSGSGRAQPQPNGPQFQVNSYTTFEQRRARVAADSAGDFVVVWQSYGSDGTDQDLHSIQGQRFDAEGIPLGPQFQVNTYTTWEQYLPTVAANASGGFVVAWESQGSNGTDNFDYSIQARVYAPDGSPLGDQFQVNTYTSNAQLGPVVASDAQGGFVVAWESNGSGGTDTNGLSIQARRYDAAGAPLGDQFQVNTYTTFAQVAPTIAVGPQGSFVIVWQGSTASGIAAQRYDSNAVPVGPEILVNEFTTGSPGDPSVAEDGQGRFVIAWDSNGSNGGDTDGRSVQARRFDSDGSPLSGDFQVNQYTTGNQYVPSVASDSGGGFVVTWQSYGSSGNDSEFESIQARTFDANGVATFGDIQADSYTSGTQIFSAVAMDPHGDFVVTWESYGSPGTDSSTFSIQGRRYDGLFRDGFESGDASRWSAMAP